MSGLRHRARILTLQILFEVDSTDHPLDNVLERHLEEHILPPEAQRFLLRLVYGVWEHRLFLDQIIEEAAPSWPIKQMPGVDKAVLRIALYELLIDKAEKTPYKAVINEAVELAKQFGSDNSGRFVNGVLGFVISRHINGESDIEMC